MCHGEIGLCAQNICTILVQLCTQLGGRTTIGVGGPNVEASTVDQIHLTAR
jgi:hypothetical protein